ncbi:TetR/AcrR family transcriptional regulator [Dactylosporangium aurantiacum]|uniref:TetR/AcrR family transcriptional regulator n=1 Tax=Dactylosporangium aurantiacum TaxID=35754 RepID=A0A9Q9IBQ1_9ACTN|nr:TetR/AcrR family transcriptional regulator [Dactylosporangium aurantiacum]MDG6102946.1 TetR/AcrR family transcriptional regulator [Dactylosporangium aurantiacum]UWZ52831.1 TetR/AcrR family transcriptional regulator [Dactylosporangium aurantiacum]
MSTSGGRTRNRRGEGGLLRDEIVAAAERILEREGDEAAITLRSVAREAGIAAPSIYAHFADRDAIIETVLDIAFERLRQRIVETTCALPDDPVASLLAGCHAYVDFAVREPARYRVLFGRLREGRPELKMPLRLEDVPPRWRNRLQAFEVLVDGLAACAAAGRSASTDPFTDATILWTSLHGAVMMRQFVPGFPWPPFSETVDALVLRVGRITA